MVGQSIRESNVINNSFCTTYINLSSSSKISEVGKGGINKFIAVLKIIGKVVKFLSSQKYDLCYMTLTAKGYGYYKDFIIVIILKLFRQKIIYHFHNKGVSSRQHKIVDNMLYRFTFKGTKSILLSSLLYNDIAAYVPRKDVFVCANGIPVIENKFSIKKVDKNTNNICKLLFLSNMMIDKGVLVLLEACKLLKENNILFECHFVGAWTDITEDEFKNIVFNYKISGNVFAHGEKYNREKIEYFLRSDIFVFPTYYHNECFPLVLLEAMEYGLALVSTPEGGIPEIIINGETGFLVSQKNAEDLANKLEILIKDPDLCTRMGENGKKRFEELYTLDKFEHNLLEILVSAAGYKK
ncbi:MAG: glycosyltransferase family 4 protein [Chitinophagaceae bacterium]|nr:glycosyltransferase family 4 protein [Chitinophagaceae bacterium]